MEFISNLTNRFWFVANLLTNLYSTIPFDNAYCTSKNISEIFVWQMYNCFIIVINDCTLIING